MIDEWSETKRAPQHAAWLHENENWGLSEQISLGLYIAEIQPAGSGVEIH
jgi:hypothetical protein